MIRKKRYEFIPTNDTPDGKEMAAFLTYQRLAENSLATWWRNVFLMTNVVLNMEKLDMEKLDMVYLFPMWKLLLPTSSIIMVWSILSYDQNVKKIIKNARAKNISMEYNWSWTLFGMAVACVHIIFTIQLIVART